jgi:alkylated DNA repair dioxygenase AlkB
MDDDTTEPFSFPAVGRKKVAAAFDSGRLTFDGGVMLLAAPRLVVAAAPFRYMATPGGHRMSVAMTNRGAGGWVTLRTARAR